MKLETSLPSHVPRPEWHKAERNGRPNPCVFHAQRSEIQIARAKKGKEEREGRGEASFFLRKERQSEVGFGGPEAKGIREAGIIAADARRVIGSLVTSCRLVN